MATRKILVDGDPVLRQRAQEVPTAEILTTEFQTLVEDMLDSMYAANGVGIAAPQVGVSKRVFIAESPEGPIALVNPVLSDYSEKTTTDEEGCLSVPGKFDNVRRAKTLHVKAQTSKGESIEFKAEGYFARIVQHENDHLDGILFIDRVAEQKLKK